MATVHDLRLRCVKLDKTIATLQVLRDATRDVLFDAEVVRHAPIHGAQTATADSRDGSGSSTEAGADCLPPHPSLLECLDAMSVISDDEQQQQPPAAAQIAEAVTEERETSGDRICGSYFECPHGLNCTHVNCEESGEPHGCRYCNEATAKRQRLVSSTGTANREPSCTSSDAS